MYNRQNLIDAAKQEIEDLIAQYSDCTDYIDLRLQLNTDEQNYEFWSGDSQYDTDHRGYWENISIVFVDDEGEDLTDDLDADELAEELVDSAIETLFANSNYKSIADVKDIDRTQVKHLSNHLEFTENSQDIVSKLEHLGIIDIDNTVGSLFYDCSSGELDECWYLESNVPYLYYTAYRIK